MQDYVEIIAQKANLTEEQKAVVAGAFPKMVIAGPGTGKTTTLVCTAAYLILSGTCAPANILALTFSRAGTARMRERVREYLGEDIALRMNIYTSDSFSSRIIASSSDVLFGENIRYRIERKTEPLYQNLLNRWQNGNANTAKDLLRPYLDYLFTPEKIVAAFVEHRQRWLNEFAARGQREQGGLNGAVKSTVETGHDLFAHYAYHLISNRSTEDRPRGYYEVVAEAIQHYFDLYEKNENTAEKEKALFDFLSLCAMAAYEHQHLTKKQVALGSLKHYAQAILLARPVQVSLYGKMYSHVLYDEFQDISIQEYTLIKSILLQQPDSAFNIAVFGDPNQSIFQYRGALGVSAYELLLFDYIRSGDADEYRALLRRTMESDPERLPEVLRGAPNGRRMLYYLLQNHRAHYPEIDSVASRFLESVYGVVLGARQGIIAVERDKRRRLGDALMNDYARQKSSNVVAQGKRDALLSDAIAAFSPRYRRAFQEEPQERVCYYVDKHLMPSQTKLVGMILERVYKAPIPEYRHCCVVVNQPEVAQEIEYELARKGISFIPYTSSFIHGDAFRYVYAAVRMGMKEYEWPTFEAFVRLHLQAEKIEGVASFLERCADTVYNNASDGILSAALENAKQLKSSTLADALAAIHKTQESILAFLDREDRQGIIEALRGLTKTLLYDEQKIFQTDALLEADIRRYAETVGGLGEEDRARFRKNAQVMLETLFDFGRDILTDRAAFSAWLDWLGTSREDQSGGYSLALQHMILRFENEGIPFVQILTPRQVKGLEFDLLIMVNADALTARLDNLQEVTNVYYVNITRPRKLLIAIGDGRATGIHNTALRELFKPVTSLQGLDQMLNRIAPINANARTAGGEERRVSRILFGR